MISIRKTVTRSICFLFALLLIHTHTTAQPPKPVETDTLAPSVTSAGITIFTASTATMGGNVTANGGIAVIERGVVYAATNAVPTVGDTKVIIGNGNGVYTQSITGLAGGTLYYVRAFATNIIGTSYGAVISFTTSPVAPGITTNEITAITNTTATVGGTVSFSGGAAVTERGIVYSSTSTNPTVADTKVQAGTGTGVFSQGLTGLVPGTIYYVRAYAINTAGTSYGNLFSFMPAAASVSTGAATAIGPNSAKLGGDITSIGGSAVTDRGVVYVQGNGIPAITDTKVSMSAGAGTFSQTVGGLLPATSYSVRAFATNSAATNYGAVQTFTTQGSLASVNRVEATPANLNLVNYTVVFTQSVTGLTVDNFALTTTGSITTPSVTAVTGSGTNWNVTVYTGRGSGTITLMMVNANNISPLLSNTFPFTGQTFTVTKIITKPIVIVNDPAYSCAPATVDLTAAAVTTGSDAGLTYAYYTDAAATVTLTTPAAVTATGTYYITGTNPLNITSDPVAVNVTVRTFANPKAGFTFDSYCSNKAVNFTNSSTAAGSGAVTYQWSDNNAHSSALAAPVFTYAATGNYNVKLKVSSQLCPLVADSITQVIGIVAPAAAIRLPLMNVIANSNNQLQARTTIGNTYQWLPLSGLSSGSIANPVVNIGQETSYTISITAASGCQTVDSLLVRIFSNYVYVPNIFSPNGDGINDILYANLIGVKELRYFRIFNRYGKKVFESTNPGVGWDGKVNGKLQPLETYVWMVEGVDKDNVQVNQQGNVTLIR